MLTHEAKWYQLKSMLNAFNRRPGNKKAIVQSDVFTGTTCSSNQELYKIGNTMRTCYINNVHEPAHGTRIDVAEVIISQKYFSQILGSCDSSMKVTHAWSHTFTCLQLLIAFTLLWGLPEWLGNRHTWVWHTPIPWLWDFKKVVRGLI